MAHRSRNLLGSGFGLAIYLVCTALVFSFIVFEVLDVDGSDFPGRHATAATTATLSEAAHDIRRAFLKGPAPVWMDAWAPFAGRSAARVRLPHAPAAQSSPPAIPHAHCPRVTLPRACLVDAPPSA